MPDAWAEGVSDCVSCSCEALLLLCYYVQAGTQLELQMVFATSTWRKEATLSVLFGFRCRTGSTRSLQSENETWPWEGRLGKIWLEERTGNSEWWPETFFLSTCLRLVMTNVENPNESVTIHPCPIYHYESVFRKRNVLSRRSCNAASRRREKKRWDKASQKIWFIFHHKVSSGHGGVLPAGLYFGSGGKTTNNERNVRLRDPKLTRCYKNTNSNTVYCDWSSACASKILEKCFIPGRNTNNGK